MGILISDKSLCCMGNHWQMICKECGWTPGSLTACKPVCPDCGERLTVVSGTVKEVQLRIDEISEWILIRETLKNDN